jgi:hypothetical protein
MKAFVNWIPSWKVYGVRGLNNVDQGLIVLYAKRVLMHDVQFHNDFTSPHDRVKMYKGVSGYVDCVDVVRQVRDISVTSGDLAIPATWHGIVDAEHVGPMIRDGWDVKFDIDRNRYMRWRGLEYEEVTAADKVFLSPAMILAMNNGEKL